MREDGPQFAENDQVVGNSGWDEETIIEQIWSDLGGMTPRADIKKVLVEVSPVYENARVKTFVPIFLRRDVLLRLQDRTEQTHRATAPKSQSSRME